MFRIKTQWCWSTKSFAIVNTNPKKIYKFYDKALTYRTDNFVVLYNKALSFKYLKEFEKALELLNESLSFNPNYTPAICQKRIVLKHLERIDSVKQIEKLLEDPKFKGVCLEKHLEDKLANDLSLLEPFGYNLELITRQKGCMDGRGRIDLFCKDKNNQQLVVIELKNVEATKSTFNQINNYLESISQIHSYKFPVIGLIIARGYDDDFRKLLEKDDEINFLDLEEDLGYE